ncbi:MAG TPA: septation protein SepH, partial [Mycobacterium sp.]|nr:septation protein SepH [Mycobacterium sp.]
VSQSQVDAEVPSVLRPKEIQAKVRAGASIEQVAESAGVDVSRVERFAHPVLLERSRAAELATASHPVLADGPAVLTLLETVTTALISRGLDPDATNWDAWRNEDGRWTVQLSWKAGLSDNVAHFRFTPGAHGGTATAFDDAACELIDPDFARPLRPVEAVAPLEFEEPELPMQVEPEQPEPAKPARASRPRNGKPPVPAWEDVLLGVRSGGQR